MYCSSILKNIYIYIYIYFIQPRNFSLHWFGTLVLFSLFFLYSLLFSLFRPKHHLFSLFLLCWVQCLGRGWVVGPVFGSWVTTWVSGGCGFWRGSLWWLFLFFFGCDRCLKGLWVVVGSGVWVVVGLWLKWVVSHGSASWV